MKKYNFCAGPATLPKEVYQKLSESVLDFEGIGLSLLEISHRSKEFVTVLEETKELVFRLMKLNNTEYSVLFLQGGASMEFFRLSQNFLNNQKKAAYVNTGVWSQKALDAAKYSGTVVEIASSKENHYRNIPEILIPTEDFLYLHITSNNTIYGTQYQCFPKFETPIVVDMSSDIFSRDIDFSQFAMIYAGVQKNLAPAGMSLIVLKNDFLYSHSNILSPIMDYKQHIANKSMLNTPPVFPIYASNLTMKWIENQGGVGVIEQRNAEKARLIYEEIDRNPLFYGHAVTEFRSKMNALFYLYDENKANHFEAMCTEAGLYNLKGHRFSGGYRVSMYNALEIEAIEILVDVMQTFEQLKG